MEQALGGAILKIFKSINERIQNFSLYESLRSLVKRVTPSLLPHYAHRVR